MEARKNFRTHAVPITVFSLIFILYLFAFIKDGTFTYWYLVEKKMSLLVIPFSIGVCSTNLNRSRLINILIAFCVATGFAYVISFIGHWNLLSFTHSNDIETILIIRRPYFGLYSFFCVLCLVYCLPHLSSPRKKGVAFAGILFFIYFSFLIYAKMSILAFVGAVIATLVAWGVVKKKYLTLTIGSCLLLSLLVAGFYISQPAQLAFEKIANGEPFKIDEQWIYFLSINMRFAIWDCSWSLITEHTNWLWGAGLGHQDLLNTCYESRSIWTKYNVDPAFLAGSTFNSHNELFHCWLDLGIVGLLTAVSVGIYSIKKAFEMKNIFYFSFLMFFFLCCMTESMLSVQKGVVFYSLFNSLIFFSSNKQ